MRRISTIALLFLFTAVHPAAEKKMIHGYIIDRESGKSLPSANIQIVGTYRGTVSNREGKYILEVPSVPAVVRVSYIGYESESVEITSDSPDRVDFLLKPVTIELEPVVVTAEDPAVGIMKEVIERKKRWRSKLFNYKVDAYTRFVLENDTGIVSIAESTSELYWKWGKDAREIIKSKRETVNIKSDQLFAVASYLPNFYDDNIVIQDSRFIGPTHTDAIKYYDFHLIGERVIDNKRVFDIEIKPKSKLYTAFKGTLSVLDEVYALIEVDLRPGESFIMPPPISNYNVSFKQQFNNFSHSFWFPVDVRMTGSVKVKFPGLEFPIIKYYQISRLTDYKINIEMVDSLFESDRKVYLDSLSIKKDTSFASVLVVPLTDRENKAYKSVDSTLTLEKAYQPSGFLANFAKIYVESGAEPSGSNKPGSSRGFLIGVSPEFRYNRVEGFHLGMNLKRSVSKRILFNLGGSYNTGCRRWGYKLGGGYKWRWGYLRVDYSDGIFPRNESRNYSTLLNTFSTLIGYHDYFDYYLNRKLSASLQLNIKKIKTRFNFLINDERHGSIGQYSDWNILKKDYLKRENPPVQNGTLRSVGAGLVIGGEFIPWGTVRQNRLELDVEYSSPHLFSSDFSFTRFSIMIDCSLPTFFRRRFLPNSLNLQLVAGTSTGTLPVQRFFGLDVRLEEFTPFGVFRTMSGQPLEGEKYLSLFWEHDFGTVLFELLGLRGLARRSIGIIIHGASGRTWISRLRLDELNHSFNYMDSFYHEIGISINRLFGILRFDVTKSLNKNRIYFGISIARMF